MPPPTDPSTAPGDPQDDAIAAAARAELEDATSNLPLTPAGLAHHMADWFKENFPEEVGTAYWMTLTQEHKQDKGVSVEIYRLPANFHADALLGGWSGGIGVFTPTFDAKRFHAKWSVGLGAACAYDHLNKPSPIAAFQVHFS